VKNPWRLVCKRACAGNVSSRCVGIPRSSRNDRTEKAVQAFVDHYKFRELFIYPHEDEDRYDNFSGDRFSANIVIYIHSYNSRLDQSHFKNVDSMSVIIIWTSGMQNGSAGKRIIPYGYL